MLRQSAFVIESSHARLIGEKKYYIVFSALLFLCGILLLAIPVFDSNGSFILAESWLLLAVLGLNVTRPMFYSRGVADVVMVIITSMLYGLLGYVMGMSVNSIEKYLLAICLALFFAGISRIIAYARMIVVVNLPLLLICGFVEMTAALLLFVGWPGNNAPAIYWFLGITVILSCFESLTEAAKLRHNSVVTE